jgi:hypothetical protein
VTGLVQRGTAIDEMSDGCGSGGATVEAVRVMKDEALFRHVLIMCFFPHHSNA